MDMQEAMMLSLTYLAGGAVILIGVVAAVIFGITNYERRKRRRLVDSKRTIQVSRGDEGPSEPRACTHLRSKSRARTEADGSIVSICKKCGVPMKRIGPGEWEAAA